MKRYVLYYQSTGLGAKVLAPEVLCVGTRERCEAVKREILANPVFGLVRRLDGDSGVMRIVPQSEGRAVVPREVPFGQRISALSAVKPV